MSSHGTSRVQRVQVSTNCFEITSLPRRTYYLYDVITPTEKIRSKRGEIIDKLIDVVAAGTFHNRALYDGAALLYTSEEVRFSGGGSQSYIVSLRRDQSTDPQNPGVFTVKITRTAGEPLRSQDFNRLIGRASNLTLSTRMTAALNLLQLLVTSGVHKQSPHRKTKTAYFVEAGKERLNHGIELWRGYFQSVRPTLTRVIVNIDTTMSVMYKGGPLIDVALEVLEKRDVRYLELRHGDPNLRKLEAFFKGLKITTETTGARTRVIRGIIARAGEVPFDKDGQETTVANYMHRKLNRRLRHPLIIGVVLSRPNDMHPTIVPAELCEVKAGQRFKKKLAGELQSRAVRFSALKPDRRLQEILGRDSPVQSYAQVQSIINSGMVITPSPMMLNAGLLQTPKLIFGNGVAVDANRGAWNVVGRKLHTPVNLAYWMVLSYVRQDQFDPAESMLPALSHCIPELGILAQQPQRPKLMNPHGDILKDLDKVVMETATASKFKPAAMQLLLVVLPDEAEQVRNHVKHWADCNRNIVTMCLRLAKVRSANNQYWNNVILKINTRLGGYNWLVRSPTWDEFVNTPFMIFGADVSHPAPGTTKPSTASLVWSIDDQGAKYAGTVRLQPPRLEGIDGLGALVAVPLETFKEQHKFLPQKILFFRDGVSEGEFEMVRQREIREIEAAIRQVCGSQYPVPKLTFILVSKRHHVTFFPPSLNGTNVDDGKGNCRPGLVTGDSKELDNVLVDRDFYLQSHAAIQGTSRSAHYLVLKDEIFNFNREKLQALAFDLCHIYAKATRSVSIPAPVYYADLACGRSAIHFKPTFNDPSETGSTVSGSREWTNADLLRYQEAFVPSTLPMYFL